MKKRREVKLSIIILNWNTKELIKECLQSLPKKREYEVIVVDNGSIDGSKEYLRRLKSIKLIDNKKNFGFAKGNNQGIEKAKGEYILLLNSDTVVKKGSLEKLVRYLDQNKNVAAVSPLLLNKDGSKQIDYYMRFPSALRVLLYHNLLLRSLIMKSPFRSLVVSEPEDKPFSVDQLPGAALMTRKEVFKKVGGLDEDYHFLFEDVDWSYRVKEEGLGELIVLPQAKIVHLGGASWKKWLKKKRFGFYRQYFTSLMTFVKKHYPKQRILFLLVLAFNFLINAVIHFFFLNYCKASTQLNLLLWTGNSFLER